MFCDICDEFGQHDTADCPLQSQVLEEESSNTQHHAHRAHERPYCENCEGAIFLIDKFVSVMIVFFLGVIVFGHWTDDCEYEEVYR